jgi:hypothetical protein
MSCFLFPICRLLLLLFNISRGREWREEEGEGLKWDQGRYGDARGSNRGRDRGWNKGRDEVRDMWEMGEGYRGIDQRMEGGI